VKVEIYKNLEWQVLTWWQGQGPVVVNEIERGGIFKFVSPVVTLSIIAENTDYVPDGSLAIVRDDEIRISAGDSNEIVIFRGVVDRDIYWNAREGVLTFAAIGWFARLRGIMAGREGIYNVTEGRYDRYRYVKHDSEEDDDGNAIDYEYIAYPELYEVGWADVPFMRFGYGKEYIFSSRGKGGTIGLAERYRVFFREGFNVPPYEIIDPGVRGVEYFATHYRRPVTAGLVQHLDVSDIVEELTVQINRELSEGFTTNVDPGVIDSLNAMVMIEKRYREGHIFTKQIEDDVNSFFIGWETEMNSQGGEKVDLFQLFQDVEVDSKPQEDIELVTPTNTDWGSNINFRRNDERPVYVQDLSWSQLNFEVRNYIYLDDNNVLIYRLRSWWSFDVDTATRKYQLPYVIVNLISGNVTAEYKQDVTIYQNPGRTAQRIEDGELGLYQSAQMVGEEPYPSSERPNRNAHEMTVEDRSYYLLTGVLHYEGNLSAENIAYEFNNKSALSIMDEICKLTNSVLFITNDKEINLVNRDYVTGNDHYLRSDVVDSVNPSITSSYGDELPVISSQIITNELFINALNAFYQDVYFPENVDKWEIVLEENSLTSAIKQFDGVYFEEIGFGEDVIPAIVQRSMIREGSVTLIVSRARA